MSIASIVRSPIVASTAVGVGGVVAGAAVSGTIADSLRRDDKLPGFSMPTLMVGTAIAGVAGMGAIAAPAPLFNHNMLAGVALGAAGVALAGYAVYRGGAKDDNVFEPLSRRLGMKTD